jgi:hypothetical protein
MARVWFTSTLWETEALWTWSDTTSVISEPLAGVWLPLRTVKLKVTNWVAPADSELKAQRTT